MKLKKILSLLLAAITLVTACLGGIAAIADGGEAVLGDVNADGAIDQFDYILVKRHYFETRYLADEEIARADVNRDGEVNQFDYILIKRHYFGTFVIESDNQESSEPDYFPDTETGEPIIVENGLYINMPKSGNLKIAQFADIHFGTPGLSYQNDKPERTKKYMQHVAEAYSPDLIVCTGDNIMSTGVKGLTEFVEFMDSLKTPWTFIFGNHDAESNASGYSKKDLSEYLESCNSEYLIYSAGYVEKDTNRYGNFSISVLSPGGTQLIGAIMLFDAGTHSSAISSYESITEGQINWYSEEIDKLNKQFDGEMIPTMVFSHIQLPEFYDAYVSAQNKNGAEFVISQPLSSAGVADIKTGGPTYENTGLYDVMVEKGSTKAYFVGHAHTFKFQVKQDGITLGFGPQTGFSTLFEDNDLPRNSYVYTFRPDFSFTTTAATEPGDDLGLTYFGTYDGSATYNEADNTYTATLTMNANHHLMFAYKGVRLTKASIKTSGDIAASSSEAAGKKLYFSNEMTLMYTGAKAKSVTFTFYPETMTLDVKAENVSADPNAPKSLGVKTVNSDAGADAIALWTEAGTKLRTVTNTETGDFSWIGNGWRYYVVVDAEGRIAYAVLHPIRGYGDPNKPGYYCNSYYSDFTKNPAIKLLDGYEDDYASGGNKYKLFEIVIPEGGFAITSHGTTNNELFDMLSQGTVDNYEINNINTRSIYDSALTVTCNAETKKIAVNGGSTEVTAPSSITTTFENKDAGADAFAVWTESGAKIRTVTDATKGTYTWIGNNWRYYIVVDAEGRIAYSVMFPDNGYGGPDSTGYYCNSYYTDYTKNPAIKLLDGYANDWADGGIGYKLFEIVIPEGGFAITAHGSGTNALVDVISRGAVEDYSVGNLNTRSIYDSDIRLAYDKETKTVSVSIVTE